jgi:hypothetical protein
VTRGIIVDYEELHRLARVWAAAAEALGGLSLRVAALTLSPAIFEGAVFDGFGAARAQAAITTAALGPSGLAGLAAVLAADAVHLDAVVAREQLVDDLPVTQLAALGRWLVAASWRLPTSPSATLRDGRGRATALAGAVVGYASPFAERAFETLAPSAVFRADAVAHRTVDVDPLFGLPISVAGRLEPQGEGRVEVSDYVPSWASTAPATLADAMSRVADLEAGPVASLAVQAVTGADGVRRFVVELPGIRAIASRQQPEDLLGAVDAMAGDTTTYSRCVRDALDSAGVPMGAQVMLVGHSDGGIVAMDLAHDPTFNGGRVVVTHVVAAGSPISSKMAGLGTSATRVLSVENVNDIVTHLDAVDSMDHRETASRLTYQYAADEYGIGANHAAAGYAQQMGVLAASPNPLMGEFEASVEPYLGDPQATGLTTTTTVFALTDGPG